MTDYPIPASAIEAAARAAFVAPAARWDDERDAARYLATAEAALRAAFDELGMEVERRYEREHPPGWSPES